MRKIAGMFVEFDSEGQADKPDGADKQHVATSGEEVLAAIEKIRTDLEKEGHTEFDEAEDVLDPGLLASRRATANPGKPGQGGMKINIGESQTARPRADATPSAPITDDSGGINVPKLLSIDEVYARAQISDSPASINNVLDMLDDPELEGLAMDIRARSVKMALKASGIGLEAILVDAGRRDQALEDYRFYLDNKLERIKEHVEAENQTLQAEVDAFVQQKQQQMEHNRRSLSEARRINEEFKAAKQAEEKRLYDIVSPFVSPGENPVELS
jgi:hypothetical protein